MFYTLNANDKMHCQICGHTSDENVIDFGLHAMGDKTFEHCDGCDNPFSITNNDDEREEFLIDYSDGDIDGCENEDFY